MSGFYFVFGGYVVVEFCGCCDDVFMGFLMNVVWSVYG